MTAAIDWHGLAGLATGVLGWSPQAFWQATPTEFQAAWSCWRDAHGLGGERGLQRSDLEHLRQRFPDG